MDRSVVQDHALPRSSHVLKHGFGKFRRRHRHLPKIDPDPATAGCGVRFDLRFITAEKDEQTSIGSGMFDSDQHQGLNELARHDLAGDGLGSPYYRP